MLQSNFTQEEITNILVLIETGARSISSQTELSKAGEVLIVASALANKIRQLNQQVDQYEIKDAN